MFLVPVVTAAFGFGALGSSLVGAALSVALGAAARALTPKPKDTAGAIQGMALSMRTDPDTPREVILGEAATAGSLGYWQVSGADNTVLDLVFPLADHECHALTGMIVNGKTVTLADEADHTYGKSWTVTEYPGVMTVKWYRGDWGQTADAGLLGRSAGVLDSGFRGRGVSYVIVTLTFSTRLYPQGLPSFLFVVRGYKMHDPREDENLGGEGDQSWDDKTTHAWSANNELAWYNWRRGISVGSDTFAGMGTPLMAFDLPSIFSEANACDESVALKGGGSETRYLVSAVVPVRSGNSDVLRSIVTGMAGEEIDSGGKVRALAGVARTSVMTLTDDDILSDAEVSLAERRTRRDLVNAVFGTARDPAQNWELIALPPRLSSGDEALDGRRYETTYQLDMVRSSTQGQRILEILRRKHRLQPTAGVTFRAKATQLEAGDWFTWQSARHGWTRIFKVVTGQPREDLLPSLTLQQVASSIYAWTPADDEIDIDAPQDLPTGAGLATTISGWNVTQIAVAGNDDAQIPALLVSWTAITDPTVRALEVEYRKEGDTVALAYRIVDPSAANATIVAGVQGGLVYEARARMVTDPARDVEWTSWDATASTPEFVVDRSVISTLTEGSLPDSTTHEMLSAQARHELALMTATATLQGSLSEHVALLNRSVQAAAEASITALLDGADNKFRIVDISGTVAGISARWGVAVVMDGPTPHVLGLVSLDGSAEGSTFSVIADHFTVAQPGEDGGDPVPVFEIGEVDGVPALALKANVFADGAIVARHLAVATLSAIAADIGEVTAGVLRSPDGHMVIDLGNKSIVMTV